MATGFEDLGAIEEPKAQPHGFEDLGAVVEQVSPAKNTSAPAAQDDTAAFANLGAVTPQQNFQRVSAQEGFDPAAHLADNPDDIEAATDWEIARRAKPVTMAGAMDATGRFLQGAGTGIVEGVPSMVRGFAKGAANIAQNVAAGFQGKGIEDDEVARRKLENAAAVRLGTVSLGKLGESAADKAERLWKALPGTQDTTREDVRQHLAAQADYLRRIKSAGRGELPTDNGGGNAFEKLFYGEQRKPAMTPEQTTQFERNIEDISEGPGDITNLPIIGAALAPPKIIARTAGKALELGGKAIEKTAGAAANAAERVAKNKLARTLTPTGLVADIALAGGAHTGAAAAGIAGGAAGWVGAKFAQNAGRMAKEAGQELMGGFAPVNQPFYRKAIKSGISGAAVGTVASLPMMLGAERADEAGAMMAPGTVLGATTGLLRPGARATEGRAQFGETVRHGQTVNYGDNRENVIAMLSPDDQTVLHFWRGHFDGATTPGGNPIRVNPLTAAEFTAKHKQESAGVFNPATGDLDINVESGRSIADIFAHEGKHALDAALRAGQPELYRDVFDAIKRRFTRDGDGVTATPEFLEWIQGQMQLHMNNLQAAGATPEQINAAMEDLGDMDYWLDEASADIGQGLITGADLGSFMMPQSLIGRVWDGVKDAAAKRGINIPDPTDVTSGAIGLPSAQAATRAIRRQLYAQGQEAARRRDAKATQGGTVGARIAELTPIAGRPITANTPMKEREEIRKAQRELAELQRDIGQAAPEAATPSPITPADSRAAAVEILREAGIEKPHVEINTALKRNPALASMDADAMVAFVHALAAERQALDAARKLLVTPAYKFTAAEAKQWTEAVVTAHGDPVTDAQKLTLAAARMKRGGQVRPGEFNQQGKPSVPKNIPPFNGPADADGNQATHTVIGESNQPPAWGEFVLTQDGRILRLVKPTVDGKGWTAAAPFGSDATAGHTVPNDTFTVLETSASPTVRPPSPAQGSTPPTPAPAQAATPAPAAGDLSPSEPTPPGYVTKEGDISTFIRTDGTKVQMVFKNGEWVDLSPQSQETPSGTPQGASAAIPGLDPAPGAGAPKPPEPPAPKPKGTPIPLAKGPGGVDDILNLIAKMGGIVSRKGTQEFDDMSKRLAGYPIMGGTETPEDLANNLHVNHNIGDGSVVEMWKAIDAAIVGRKSNRLQETQENARQRQAEREHEAQMAKLPADLQEKITRPGGAEMTPAEIAQVQAVFPDFEYQPPENAPEPPTGPAPQPPTGEPVPPRTGVAVAVPVEAPDRNQSTPIRLDEIEQVAASAKAEAVAAEKPKKDGTYSQAAQDRIRKAELMAVIRAHSDRMPLNHEGIRLRTDPFGRETVSGKLDESADFDNWLLNQSSLAGKWDAIGNLLTLQNSLGKTLQIDYGHAPTGDASANADARRAAQAKATAEDRARGEAPMEVQRKTIVPLEIQYNPGTESFTVLGASPEKLLSNWTHLQEAYGILEEPMPYRDIHDPRLVADMKGYVRNHQNNRQGDGSTMKGKQGERIDPTGPAYPIAEAQFEFLNALMGDESAKSETKQGEAKASLAQFNDRMVNAQAGETNPLRERINAKMREKFGEWPVTDENGNPVPGKFTTWTKGNIENPLSEALRPDLIQAIHQETTRDDASIRPAGYKGDVGRFLGAGIPERGRVAAGFMPEEGSAALIDTKKLDEQIRAASGAKKSVKLAAIIRQIIRDAREQGDTIPMSPNHEQAWAMAKIVNSFKPEYGDAFAEAGRLLRDAGLTNENRSLKELHGQEGYFLNSFGEDFLAGRFDEPIKRGVPNIGVRAQRGFLGRPVPITLPDYDGNKLPAFLPEEAGAENASEAIKARAAKLWKEKGTESPFFKKWFGKSKVVDAQGKPKGGYHGTNVKFTEFKHGEFGFHIGSKGQAEQLIANRSEQSDTPTRGTLMEVYVKIENPLRIDDVGNFTPDAVAREAINAGALTRREANPFLNPEKNAYVFDPIGARYDNPKTKQLRELLKSKGYDGIVYSNTEEIGGDFFSEHGDDPDSAPAFPDSYIAFDPTQIKSATGNQGTFDAQNPDIRFLPEDPRDQARVRQDDRRRAEDQLRRRLGSAYGSLTPREREQEVAALLRRPERGSRYMPEEGIGGYADPVFDIPQEAQAKIYDQTEAAMAKNYPGLYRQYRDEIGDVKDEYQRVFQGIQSDLSNRWARENPRTTAARRGVLDPEYTVRQIDAKMAGKLDSEEGAWWLFDSDGGEIVQVGQPGDTNQEAINSAIEQAKEIGELKIGTFDAGSANPAPGEYQAVPARVGNMWNVASPDGTFHSTHDTEGQARRQARTLNESRQQEAAPAPGKASTQGPYADDYTISIYDAENNRRDLYRDGNGRVPGYPTREAVMYALANGLYPDSARVEDPRPERPRRPAPGEQPVLAIRVRDWALARGINSIEEGFRRYADEHPNDAEAQREQRRPAPGELPKGYRIQILSKAEPGVLARWTLIGPDGTGRAFTAGDRADAMQQARSLLPENLAYPSAEAPQQRAETPRMTVREMRTALFNMPTTQATSALRQQLFDLENQDDQASAWAMERFAAINSQTAEAGRQTPAPIVPGDIEFGQFRLQQVSGLGWVLRDSQNQILGNFPTRSAAESHAGRLDDRERGVPTPRMTEAQTNAQWDMILERANREIGARRSNLDIGRAATRAFAEVLRTFPPNYSEQAKLGEILQDAMEGSLPAVNDLLASLDDRARRETPEVRATERQRLEAVKAELEREARSSMPRLPQPRGTLSDRSPLASLHTDLDGKIVEQQASIVEEIKALTEQIDADDAASVEDVRAKAELEEFRRSLVEDHAGLNSLRESLRLANPTTLTEYPRAFAEIRRLEVRGLISHEAKERAYDALSDRQNTEIARQIIAEEEARPERERQGRIDAKIRVAQREAAKERTVQETLWDEMLRAKEQRAIPKIVRLLRQISRNDEAFQYTTSKAKDPVQIAADISTPNSPITVSVSRYGDIITWRSKNGAISIYRADTDRPEIGAPGAGSQGKKEGGGAQMYKASLDWAINNGKQIQPSNALSEINAYVRRTAAMESSAIQHNTTAHMIPDDGGHGGRSQGVRNWIDTSKMPEGKEKRAADANNIAQLSLRASEQVMKAVPELQPLDFDFKTGKIKDSRTGNEITPADITKILETKGKKLTYERGIGVSTAQRAILIASAIREAEGGSLARPDRGRGVRVLKEQGKMFYMPEDTDVPSRVKAGSARRWKATYGDEPITEAPGWWLDRHGNLYPITEEHNEIAEDLPKSEGRYDGLREGFKAGMVRVSTDLRMDGDGKDVYWDNQRKPLNETQRKALRRLAQDKGGELISDHDTRSLFYMPEDAAVMDRIQKDFRRWEFNYGRHWKAQTMEEAAEFLGRSEEQMAALNAYMSGGFTEMSQNPDHPVTQALVKLLKRMPSVQVPEIHRALGFMTPEDRDAYLQKIGAEGATAKQERAITSWTTHDPKGVSFPKEDSIALEMADMGGPHTVILTVKNPTNAKDISFGYSPGTLGGMIGTNEVLLPPGTKMKVESIRRTGDQVHVEMAPSRARETGSFMPEDQTETPAFKKWFGQSKVVDAQGKPRVVHHGTDDHWTVADPSMIGRNTGDIAKPHYEDASTGDIWSEDRIKDDMVDAATRAGADEKDAANMAKQALVIVNQGRKPTAYAIWEYTMGERSPKRMKAFERVAMIAAELTQIPANGATFFTDRPDIAKTYTSADYEGGLRNEGESGPQIKATYLKIENPLKIDAKGEYWDHIPYQGSFKTTDELIRIARAQGKDGLIVENVWDTAGDTSKPGTTYAVFHSTQIKSATQNTGAFDPSNPDIRFMPEDTGKPGESGRREENLAREAEQAGVNLSLETLKRLTRGDQVAMNAVRRRIEERTGAPARFMPETDVYRGSETPEDHPKLGDFGAVFAATDIETAKQYGEHIGQYKVDDSTLLDTSDDKARRLAAAFIDEPIPKEEWDDQFPDFYMFPTEEFAAFLTSAGYTGFKTGKDIAVFDPKSFRRFMPESAPDNRQRVKQHTIKVAMREIEQDMKDGTVPRTATSFGELQEHTDANLYVNDAEREDRRIGPLGKSLGWKPQDYADFTNEIIAEIDKRLSTRQRERQHSVQVGDARMTDGPQEIRMPRFLPEELHHGTPHEVDRFTTKKIGTGEGAQAYGWGLYFAQSRAVAKDYAKKLGGEYTVALNADGSPINTEGMSDAAKKLIREATNTLMVKGRSNRESLKVWHESLTDQKETALRWARQGENPESNRAYAKAVDEVLAATKNAKLEHRLAGNLYTVRIKPDADAFLDWDKPLSEQSEKVKAAVKKLGIATNMPGFELGGGQIYDAMRRLNEVESRADELAKKRGYSRGNVSQIAQAASEKLASLGIAGIRYLDQGSRNQGPWTVVFKDGRKIELGTSEAGKNLADAARQEGTLREFIEPPKPTSNYVIFNEADIEITHRNGEPATPAERREAMQNPAPGKGDVRFMPEAPEKLTAAARKHATAKAFADSIQNAPAPRQNNEVNEPHRGEWKPGQLYKDDYGENPFIYEGQDIDPRMFGDLLKLEGEKYDTVVNMPTTQRYIEWYKQGEVPPPITVIKRAEGVENEGKLVNTDRRRVVAAIEAGVKTIPALVEIGRANELWSAATKSNPAPGEQRFMPEDDQRAYEKAGVEVLRDQDTGGKYRVAVKLDDGTVLIPTRKPFWSAHIDAAASLPSEILDRVVDGGFVKDGKWEPGGDLHQGLEKNENVHDYYGIPRDGAGFMPEDEPSIASLRDEFKRTSLISTGTAKRIMGDKPDYLDAVVDFMAKQRAKTVAGKLTKRDVAKAYLLTLSSIGAGGISPETFTAKTGMKVPSRYLSVEGGKQRIRPEEAAALWMGTKDGKAALDAIEAGNATPDMLESLLTMRDAFGRNDIRNNALRVGGRQRTLANIAEVTDEINAAKGNVEQIGKALTSLTGIAGGKIGFIKHLLGLGDTSTVDAVELNFWLTGKGSTRQQDGTRQELVRNLKERGLKNPSISKLVTDRIGQQVARLARQYDLDPEVASHIIHHWLWDTAKDATTTHKGMMEAQARYMPDESAPQPPERPARGAKLPDVMAYGRERRAWIDRFVAWSEKQPRNKPIVLADGDDRTGVITPAIGGGYRITRYLDIDGEQVPHGHQEFKTREEAVKDALAFDGFKSASDRRFMPESAPEAPRQRPDPRSAARLRIDQRGAGFANWTKGTKVVENPEQHEFNTGEPVTVIGHHGSAVPITAFDVNKAQGIADPQERGIYFLTTKEMPERYAKMASQMGRGKEPTVTSAYLRMENPFVGPRKSFKQLRAEGYDAWIGVPRKDSPEKGVEIAVFNGNQIKSSTDNSGAFDPKNPDIRFMPEAEDIERANRTARAAGAVGSKAITPRYVAETLKPGETVLNFGAGKPDASGKYGHSETIRAAGGLVTEHDFGRNAATAAKDALAKNYDTVFASNVLNVQSGIKMLTETLEQIKSSAKKRAVFNFPESPRYSDLTAEDVAAAIKNTFGSAPKKVGGTNRAPLWEVEITATAPRSAPNAKEAARRRMAARTQQERPEREMAEAN